MVKVGKFFSVLQNDINKSVGISFFQQPHLKQRHCSYRKAQSEQYVVLNCCYNPSIPIFCQSGIKGLKKRKKKERKNRAGYGVRQIIVPTHITGLQRQFEVLYEYPFRCQIFTFRQFAALVYICILCA